MNQDNKDRNTQVIAIGNQKGGVGKTSNTVQLATALGEMGNRCLIIDLDAGHGATRHFGIPSDYLGTFEVLAGLEEPQDVAMTNDDDVDLELPPNVHIIPARRNLEHIDETLRAKSKFYVPRDILLEPIEKLRGEYDYVFLDTAPSATTPTVAAYWASDWFILSAMPEHFAIEGLADALQDISDAQQGGGHLKLLGVVITAQQTRPRISKALTVYIEEAFGAGEDGRSYKFETEIGRSVVLTDAQAEGKTIFQTHPNHKITDQYRDLAREVRDRIVAWSSETLQPVAPPETHGQPQAEQPSELHQSTEERETPTEALVGQPEAQTAPDAAESALSHDQREEAANG